MKTIIKNIITEEDAKKLIKYDRGSQEWTDVFNSVLVVMKEKLKSKILEGIDWRKPSYVRFEKNGKHKWHVDTGGDYGSKGHMKWCDYGCSILLSKPDTDCGFLEYKDGTKFKHYCDLIIHDSSIEHRITPYSGERRTIIGFFKLESTEHSYGEIER